MLHRKFSSAVGKGEDGKDFSTEVLKLQTIEEDAAEVNSTAAEVQSPTITVGPHDRRKSVQGQSVANKRDESIYKYVQRQKLLREKREEVSVFL